MNNFKTDKEIKAFKKAVKIYEKEITSITSAAVKNTSLNVLTDKELDAILDNSISDFWLKGIKEEKLIDVDGYSFDVVQLIEPLKDLNRYCNSYPMLLEKHRDDALINKEVLDVIKNRTDLKPNNEPFKV